MDGILFVQQDSLQKFIRMYNIIEFSNLVGIFNINAKSIAFHWFSILNWCCNEKLRQQCSNHSIDWGEVVTMVCYEIWTKLGRINCWRNEKIRILWSQQQFTTQFVCTSRIRSNKLIGMKNLSWIIRILNCISQHSNWSIT